MQLNFKCHKCGKDVDSAPAPPLKAICEDVVRIIIITILRG